jgi:hypothetical protein
VPRFGLLGATDLASQGKFGEKGHSVTVGPLAEGGDLGLEVKNLGGEAGTISVKVSVKAPKQAKGKLDLRGVRFGLPGGGETVLGRTVKAEAGATILVEDPSSGLAGTSIDIPAAALSADTRIVATSSPDVAMPEEDQPAGPALALGPPGTTFAAPVTIVLPFDPALRQKLGRGFGEITLGSDGTWTGEGNGFAGTFTPDSVGAPPGSWSEEKKDGGSVDGTYTVDTDGSVLLSSMGDGGPEEFRYYSGATGQIMFGSDRNPSSNDQFLRVMVRKGSKMGASSMVGDYARYSIETTTSRYQIRLYQDQAVINGDDGTFAFYSGYRPGSEYVAQVGDFQLFNQASNWHFDGKSNQVTATAILEKSAYRDVHKAVGYTVVLDPEDPGPDVRRFTVGESGSYVYGSAGDDVFVGAVTADGVFGIGMDDPKGPLAIFGFDMFLKLPPARAP